MISLLANCGALYEDTKVQYKDIYSTESKQLAVAKLHCVSQPADLKSKVYIVKYDLICLRMFATFFDGHIWHFS